MNALRVVMVALVLAAVVAAIVGLPLVSWAAGTVAWADGHRAAASALLVGAYVVAGVLALPGTVLTLAAGFVFGLPLGVVLASISSVLGATAAFAVGRFVARDWVAERVSTRPRFRALDAATHHDGFTIVLLARLSLVLPYNLLNYGFGLTATRFRDYVLASWLGMLPATVLYVYAGSIAQDLTALARSGLAPGWATQALLALGFTTTLALVVLITRRATRILRERLATEPPSGADSPQ